MIVYSALGDSITAGYNASSPQRAYPNQVRAELQARGGGGAVEVLAQPGWTSGALRGALLDGGLGALRGATTVTIWVGGNDLANAGLRALQNGGRGAPQAVAGTIGAYGGNIAALVTAVRSVCQAQILLCTQYNPFPNSPLAVEAVSALNQATLAAASQLRVGVVPVHKWFAGREAALIAGYRSGRIEEALRSPHLPIHPNDAGHAVIAQGLGTLIR